MTDLHISPVDRPARHICAEDLQRDEMEELDRICAARGCAIGPALALAGFFVTLAIGMSNPVVVAAVMGGH